MNFYVIKIVNNKTYYLAPPCCTDHAWRFSPVKADGRKFSRKAAEAIAGEFGGSKVGVGVEEDANP